jgi:hypothetical protein
MIDISSATREVDRLLRTKPIFFAQSDGRIEVGVRCYYENFYREFVAGITADRDEAHRLAEALEARLRAASAS